VVVIKKNEQRGPGQGDIRPLLPVG